MRSQYTAALSALLFAGLVVSPLYLTRPADICAAAGLPVQGAPLRCEVHALHQLFGCLAASWHSESGLCQGRFSLVLPEGATDVSGA